MQDLKSLKEAHERIVKYFTPSEATTDDLELVVSALPSLIAELEQLRAEKAAKVPLSRNEIQDMAFGYAPSGQIGELMQFAERLLDRAASAKPSDPMPRLPATPKEVVAFIGSHFEYIDDKCDDPQDQMVKMSIHDLLSAFRDWEPVEQ